MENIDLWNKKNLKPPPIASYKINRSSVDVHELENVIKKGLYEFNNYIFNKEAAFLSRLIYCLKTKLRHNKVMKMMQKLNQGLLRYLRTNLVKHFEVFVDMIPEDDGVLVNLPTRSMLQYLLVRLQGIAKLMVHVVETSQILGGVLLQLIRMGHLWKILFVCFGVVSRIYVLSKKMAETCCSLYSLLLPFQKGLQDFKNHWLPSTYKLPNDLKLWLNTDCLDVQVSQESNSDSTYLSILKNVDADKWFDEIEYVKHAIPLEVNNRVETVEEDVGVPLNEINFLKKTKQKKNNNIGGSINSLQDLKKFQVNFKRNPEKYTNNFKKMDRMQCNMLQNLICKYIRKMNKNNSEKNSKYLSEVKNALKDL